MKWVKCSERLPPFGLEVFCRIIGFSKKVAVYDLLTLQESYEGKIYFESFDNGHYEPIKDVTHWCEITPPKD